LIRGTLIKRPENGDEPDSEILTGTAALSNLVEAAQKTEPISLLGQRRNCDGCDAAIEHPVCG
jgi:hypothetical protein